jgi:hypothetical protein
MYREKVTSKEMPEKDNADLYGERYVWKRNGPDHFCFALLYAIVGMDKYGGGLAKIIDTKNWIETLPKGKIVDNPVILGDHIAL